MIDKGMVGCCGFGPSAKSGSSRARWPLARPLVLAALALCCLSGQSYASLFSADSQEAKQPSAADSSQHFNRLQTAVSADPSIREYKKRSSGGFLSSLWGGSQEQGADVGSQISDDSAEVIQVVFEGDSAKENKQLPSNVSSRTRRAIFGTLSGNGGLILEGHAEQESGPWGPWEEQQGCSRTCGGGVKVEMRTCSGSGCKGPTKRYTSCNIEQCSGSGVVDFRALQCSEYDDKPFEGSYHKWLPYLAKNKCELTCIPQGQPYYYPFQPKVADGTRCDSEDVGNGVCVDGLCFPLGCDGTLGSSMAADNCGVCNGDGSTCKTVKGLFDTTRLARGYHDIITIEEGATSINIHERRAFRNNYLAIRNESGGYYLNGDFKMDFPGTFDIAGTVFRYIREGSSDRLSASGPTQEKLTFSLVYQDESPTGSAVDYEYSVPLEEVQFEYSASPWSPCSVTCGEGVEERRLTCVDKSSGGRPVAEENCVNASMPETNRTCNTVDCAAEWFVGDWEECSSSCGDYGLQYRVIYCHQILADGSHVTKADGVCATQRPDYQQTCNRFPCPEWNAGPWSSCSQLCGDAMQYRSVTCRSEKDNEELKLLPAAACPDVGEPENARSCNLGPCEGLRWVATDWKLCSKCNDTMESRNVTCEDGTGRLYPGEKCPEERPEDSRDCEVKVPCVYQWHASQWSECSTACGHGHQIRSVFCAIAENGHLTKMDASHCDLDMKVVDRKNCTNEENCTGTYYVSQWEQCSATCGGGSQSRSVVCLDYDMREDKTACDESKIPKFTQDCNTQSCDVCLAAEFGCCPDNVTLANGPYLEGCSNCTDSEFGCCSDNITVAAGPDSAGCGSAETGEEGSGEEGSEESIPSCLDSEFGCCLDNSTAASGPELEGCPEPMCNYTAEEGATVEIPCSNITDSVMEIDNSTLSGNETMTNETVEITCKDSEFGCCPDWFTEAEGADFAGCDPYVLGTCNDTHFGCCPDELTLARGEDFEGCGQESCSASKFGCCQDRQTIAFGPHYEGCERSSLTCETSKWGCCPDGGTAALGDKGEGCGEDCLVTKHGCCPDGKTAREGPGGEGCGCATSQYGCCSDGKTKATGPQFRGCPDSCATTAFGCCPDGKTVQKGARREGCPCQYQRFGCCPDGETAARGPKHAGCDDCRLWKFGCCPDGITKAQGQRYEGCFKDETTAKPTVPTGPIAPEKIRACTLQSDVGTNCKQYQIQYFYNAKDGKCQQFWYGGCDGNLNRFATNEICERTCINPPGDGICHLPQSAGERSCGEPKSRVYFNAAMGQCEYFWFFCRGNGNSFASHDECYQTCGHIRDQLSQAGSNANRESHQRQTERPRATASPTDPRQPISGQQGQTQPDDRRREEEERRRADYERQRQAAEARRAEEERRRLEEANRRRRPPTGEISPEGRLSLSISENRYEGRLSRDSGVNRRRTHRTDTYN